MAASSSRQDPHGADLALALELQSAQDAETAAALQRELDEEGAFEVQDELDALRSTERHVAALKKRLERSASKEITHLGKATLRQVNAQMRTGESLGGILRACRDELALARLLDFVDSGQRERVHSEILSLLLDDEVRAGL